MNDLISRKALLEEMEKAEAHGIALGDEQSILVATAIAGTREYIVQMVPAVDAVEVVRCGECRLCDTAECPMSRSPGRVSASDFCSYGERRTDNA